MNKLMQHMTLAALAALSIPLLHAQTDAMAASERTRADLSITYSALHMNSPVGSCGCFWLSGGSAEVAVPLWHFLSAVGEFSGEHAGNIPGSNATGISLITGMGGVRVGYRTHHLFHPFAQGLLGGVHAFNSYFPTTSAEESAKSFAMAAGGGLDISVRRHILVRPIQVEYQYMQLPNNASDQQHDLRLSAGMVYRFSR